MSNIEQYKIMHAAGAFPGHSTKKNSAEIAELIRRHGAKSILVYGSGKGLQYSEQKLHEEWGVEVPTLYVPAVPGIDKLPNALRPFDGVICCDVLEHLEGQDLRNAIFHVTLRASKFAFFSISCRPAKKTLPDGRNAHLTIQPEVWWRATIDAVQRLAEPVEVVLKFDHGESNV